MTVWIYHHGRDCLLLAGAGIRPRGEHSYPADYPEPGTEITVVGTFQTYEENGYMDYHLADAEMTE